MTRKNREVYITLQFTNKPTIPHSLHRPFSTANTRPLPTSSHFLEPTLYTDRILLPSRKRGKPHPYWSETCSYRYFTDCLPDRTAPANYEDSSHAVEFFFRAGAKKHIHTALTAIAKKTYQYDIGKHNRIEHNRTKHIII